MNLLKTTFISFLDHRHNAFAHVSQR